MLYKTQSIADHRITGMNIMYITYLNLFYSD